MSAASNAAERRATAEATYLALCALDPDANPRERSEALASGIAPEQVESLYPLSLDAIALPLIDHFQHTGVEHLQGEAVQSAFNKKMQRESDEVGLWPKSLAQSFRAHHPSLRPYTESIWELLDFLRDQVPPPPPLSRASGPGPVNTYYAFPVRLWSAWWLMGRRESLASELQEQAEARMCWIAEHLLPNLTSDQVDTSQPD